MTTKQLTQRVANLETAVADLRNRLAEQPTSTDWLKKVAGSMRDEPEFEKVIRYGREFRQGDRPNGDPIHSGG